MDHYIYLLLNVFIIGIPLAFSFGHTFHFISNLRHVIVAIIVGLIVFIPWDMGFTAMKIWSFNSNYILGVYIINIPIEEILFFISVPFLFLFIHELLKHYVKRDFLRGTHFSMTPAATIAFSLLLMLNFDNTYSAVSITVLILLLLIQLIKLNRYMSRFYISFVAYLIPFFIINEILTFLPIIEYNETVTLGKKLGSIPLDNLIYNAGLLLLVTMVYEWSKRKFSEPKSS